MQKRRRISFGDLELSQRPGSASLGGLVGGTGGGLPTPFIMPSCLKPEGRGAWRSGGRPPCKSMAADLELGLDLRAVLRDRDRSPPPFADSVMDGDMWPPYNWVEVRYAPGRWQGVLRYRRGRNDIGDLRTWRLFEQFGILNLRGLQTQDDWTAPPTALLGLADPVPQHSPLYIIPRFPVPVPGTQDRPTQIGLYIEGEGGAGCIPVFASLNEPPQQLDHVVMALSGTGAKPDYWYGPRRLERDVPLVLQFDFPLTRVAGFAVSITWSFAVERHVAEATLPPDVWSTEPPWAAEIGLAHFPVIARTPDAAPAALWFQPPPTFFGAQQDLIGARPAGELGV